MDAFLFRSRPIKPTHLGTECASDASADEDLPELIDSDDEDEDLATRDKDVAAEAIDVEEEGVMQEPNPLFDEEDAVNDGPVASANKEAEKTMNDDPFFLNDADVDQGCSTELYPVHAAAGSRLVAVSAAYNYALRGPHLQQLSAIEYASLYKLHRLGEANEETAATADEGKGTKEKTLVHPLHPRPWWSHLNK